MVLQITETFTKLFCPVTQPGYKPDVLYGRRKTNESMKGGEFIDEEST